MIPTRFLIFEKYSGVRYRTCYHIDQVIIIFFSRLRVNSILWDQKMNDSIVHLHKTLPNRMNCNFFFHSKSLTLFFWACGQQALSTILWFFQRYEVKRSESNRRGHGKWHCRVGPYSSWQRHVHMVEKIIGLSPNLLAYVRTYDNWLCSPQVMASYNNSFFCLQLLW